MHLIHEDSLAGTLDEINQVYFYGQPLLYEQREQAAHWIAARAGKAGSYCGMPAPTEHDRATDVLLFTGETITTGAGKAHILGEESLRAMRLLGVEPAVQQHAAAGMLERLEVSAESPRFTGGYCCGTCTAALMRNLSAGGLGSRSADFLPGALRYLRQVRHEGKWRFFPFYYTLLALLDVPLDEAREELLYAAPAMQRSYARLKSNEGYAPRRRAVLERALACV